MFIVIEGVDGCGKGTQVDLLSRAIGAVPVKYPDRATPLGRLVNRWLHGEIGLGLATPQAPPPPYAPGTPWWTPAAEEDEALALQGLLLANKIEVQGRLQSLLRSGARIVADRYSPSAVAYGSADGLSTQWLTRSHEGLLPADLNVLLDVRADVALQRIAGRVNDDSYGGVKERIERAGEAYRVMALDDPAHWLVFNGTRPADEIAANILVAVKARFGI